MSKAAFAQTIIAKLKGAIGTDGQSYTSGSAPSAMAAVASAITEYLIANTQVTVSYSGIISSTPPMPDPVVTDNFRIVGTCAPASPSNSFDSWIKQIESNIIAGFTLAPSGAAGVTFAQVPFLTPGIATTISLLESVHNVADKSPQQKVWEEVCGGIMDWINGPAMNATPGPASRPAAPSAGVASIVKIIIS